MAEAVGGSQVQSYGTLENKLLTAVVFWFAALAGYIYMGVFHAGAVFALIIACSTFFFRPKYFIEPLTILTAYYAAFFVIPMFAQRYSNISFTHENVVFAYRMATVTFTIGATVFFLMRPPEDIDAREPFATFPKMPLEFFAVLNLPICFFFGYLLFESTGGIERWSELGGLAILQRRGSGMLTVAFMFTSFAELAALGFLGLVRKRLGYLVLGIFLLLVFAPLYGGKLRIAQACLILIAPVAFRMRLFSRAAFGLGALFFAMFIAVNTWRASSWITWRHFIPGSFPPLYSTATSDSGYIYFQADAIDATQQSIWSHSLNYFDVLENMLMALQDMAAGSAFTLLMPFNKLRELGGAQLQAADYDLGSFLTRTYYPHVYDLGATTQWPVEIDLWLSFGFSPAWVILLLLFASFGWLYRLSMIYRTPQMYLIWGFTSGYMLTHLRGGFFVWTDLYVFPILLTYFIVISVFFRAGEPDTAATRNVRLH